MLPSFIKGVPMEQPSELILITDIGSTTTKALLIDGRPETPQLLAVCNAPTTVEDPVNDVRYGVKAAITELERMVAVELLQKSEGPELQFADNVAYFSTSSAGGGLQILVIGLTLFDSASSGKRSAYGAGGVILDTIAIDDKRQAREQMLAIRKLHPDLILISGGIDGGAISGVLRLAEIVRIADPKPKFHSGNKIPAIFAGNSEAAPIIKKLISDSFDLHIMPNIRPRIDAENLQPTQEMIQKLFMENVMEHAPGYSLLKKSVSADILPTPLGVQNALQIASDDETRNIFAFDIGGATTDVFSFIQGYHQRTVSANLGMSYSAWNVLKESGLSNVMRWLPENIAPQEVRNYIANKCLHPTGNPKTTNEYRIEHALAREALKMALEQHRQMHYNKARIGFLDKLKMGDKDKYEQIFEYQREDAKFSFHESDIDVLIGAGGVFAHSQNTHQCVMILIDAIRLKGITEVWIDRQFISPHMGVLYPSEPVIAKKVFERECIEKLALFVCPTFDGASKKKILRLEMEYGGKIATLEIGADEFIHIPAGTKKIRLEPINKARLKGSKAPRILSTDLPLIIDTRRDAATHVKVAEAALQTYQQDGLDIRTTDHKPVAPAIKAEEWIREIKLPYSGDINYSQGDSVQADDVVAVNRYNPPRLYIVNGFANTSHTNPELVSRSLRVTKGDSLDIDQVYGEIPSDADLPGYRKKLRQLISPVQGKIEYIDPTTGLIVLSEIQNYSSKPTRVNFAEAFQLPPKKARRYLTKRLGDFVYRGDLLGKRLDTSPVILKAPSTGTISEINLENGFLTISYLHKPLEFQAHVSGKVTEVHESKSISICYQARQLEARIAFGQECHGRLEEIKTEGEIESAQIKDEIAVLHFAPDRQNLNLLAKLGAKGVVCYQMDATELVNFLGFEPGVINTGNEILPLTLLILSGFGTLPMPEAILRDLEFHTVAYLNPHTRIRAGVVRPFIAF